MVYFFVIVLLLILILHFDIRGSFVNRELWYRIVLILLIFISGMRYRIGVDTVWGIDYYYHDNCTIQDVFKNLSLFEYPLWKILNSIVYTFGGRWFVIQFIQSAFINILLFIYIKKHCNCIFTCVFFYFIWMYASFNFEEMKASIALVICLFANDYILEKKYILAIVLYVIACLFHFSAFIFVLSLLLLSFKFNIRGFILLLFGIVISSLIQRYFSDYLFFLGFDDFLQNKAEGYSQSEKFFYRSIVGFRYILYHFIPMLVWPICSYLYLKKHQQNDSILQLEPFLVIFIFYVIISINIVIVYRLVNFYSIYAILFISQAFINVAKNKKSPFPLLKSVVIFLPFVYFVWTTYVGVNNSNSRYHKFYPYVSIIDRKVDKSRERTFNENRAAPYPNYNEY